MNQRLVRDLLGPRDIKAELVKCQLAVAGAPLQSADGRTPGSGTNGMGSVQAWGIGHFERPVSVVE